MNKKQSSDQLTNSSAYEYKIDNIENIETVFQGKNYENPNHRPQKF